MQAETTSVLWFDGSCSSVAVLTSSLSPFHDQAPRFKMAPACMRSILVCSLLSFLQSETEPGEGYLHLS